MNLIDVIKNKIKCKSKKAFGKNYAEFCEVEKRCSDVASFSDKALDKFARRNTDYPTREEFEEHKKQIQRDELDSGHEFRKAYFVKKCREKNDDKTGNNPYQLSEKVKENISRAIGLPFDEIVNMDFEDLEKHIEQRIEKKPTYDLRLRIDDIPIDEEHIITIEQVDKELDKTTNGYKLVLKRKSNNDSK